MHTRLWLVTILAQEEEVLGEVANKPTQCLSSAVGWYKMAHLRLSIYQN